MLVKLNPGQPFWMLLDDTEETTVFSLNYENPGPVELDVASLSKTNKQRLANALAFHIVKRVDQATQQEVEPKTQKPAIKVNHLIENNPIAKAKEILHGNTSAVAAACEALVKESNLEMLETLRALEVRGENQNGAARKTVLATIDKAIHKCGGLTAIIESEITEVKLVQEDPEEAENA